MTQITEQQNEWVSVKERLPEIGERVLVSAIGSHANYMVCYRNMRGTWKNSNGKYVHDDAEFITHWQHIKPKQ